MEKIVYVLETKDDGHHSFVDRKLFLKEWAYQLSKNLQPIAFIVDYSNFRPCDYREYQNELK